MLIALADYARRHGRDPATARQRAGRGAFQSAVKIGRDWLIDDQEPWIDSRIHTGEYINARKQEIKEHEKMTDSSKPD